MFCVGSFRTKNFYVENAKLVHLCGRVQVIHLDYRARQ